ncbi:MAG: PIN domain-containing protein [Paludibacteraceae bacterium]|nr:PIN domain-containing protein [Lachnospiraceae bacterium]MBR5822708.1 PIN domain-containing protein [Paludibacteraceae bacterium]
MRRSTFFLFGARRHFWTLTEILASKTTPSIASNVVSIMLNAPNIRLVTPYYRFALITTDPDDNKFVDCAIASGADCLVTNDTHFKILTQTPFPKVSTLSLQEFCKELWEYNCGESKSSSLNEPSIPYGQE